MKHEKAYVSEYARFMDGYLRAHPEVRRDQVLGWRIWWEKPVRPQQRDAGDSVARAPYYYD
jgi:hypothetical protein